MKTNFKIGTIMMLIAFVVFTSCKKEVNNEEENVSQELQTSSADNALAESSSTEMETMSDEAAKGKQGFVSYASACVVITYDTLNALKVITIDFGDVNCICNDNRYRRGKIIISFSGGTYFDEGNVITISTDNYFVNDNQIVGSKSITNVGNYTHHIVADWEIIKANNGGTITWVSDRNRIQTIGMDTPTFIGDDTYEVSGTASGVNKNGRNYSISTQTNLVKEIACQWIKSGILNITVGNKSGSIDFGDGTCDDQAIVSRNGESKVITLK
jgi:hypothetical protein